MATTFYDDSASELREGLLAEFQAAQYACANSRCGKVVPKDSKWFGYCGDACAWGHREIDDAR